MQCFIYSYLRIVFFQHEGKFFLALAELTGIQFLQYNGWKFVTTYKINFEAAPMDGAAADYFSVAMKPLIINNRPHFSS